MHQYFAVAFTTHTLNSPVSTHHVEFLMLVEERGERKGGEAAGDEGDVCVDDATVLVIPWGSSGVEGRPVQPQKDCT